MKPSRFLSPIALPLLFLAGETACGKSPILHHTTASGQTANTASGATPGEDSLPAGSCPLEFKKSSLCASFEWVGAPAARKKLSFHLKFWRKNDGAATGPFADPSKTPYVLLWMPSMGHGSSEVTLSRRTDSHGVKLTGQYESNDAYFIMGGPWDVHVQLKDGETVADEAILKVSL